MLRSHRRARHPLTTVRDARSLALLLALASVHAGCATMLPGMIARSQNRGKTVERLGDPSERRVRSLGAAEHFRVDVGPPDASLSVWVFDPPRDPPKGTILVLHGFHDHWWWMRDNGLEFADAGYSAVLPDLRGHGRSTGDFVTFGVVEKHDLAQLVDELDRRGLLAGRLGVYGMSYGAATAIQFAAIDPRVDAVVAVAPFANMRDVAPRYTRIFRPVFGWLISDREYQQAITEAGQRAGYNPDDASPETAIARVTAPVLVVHGESDFIVPADHARRIHANSDDNDELLLVAGAGHFSIWMDFKGIVRDRSIDWFNRHLRKAGR